MSDGEFQIPQNVHDQIREDILWDRIQIQEPKKKNMTGIELITQERLEQKTVHNHSLKNDYELNKKGELANAAQALLEGDVTWMPEGWDPKAVKKMLSKPYKDRLIIAGALIAAEIDRLNYKP